MTELTHSKVWNEVKDYYREKFGISPDLVDIAAVYDILNMCASGSGTPQIANFLDMEPELISHILEIHFGFTGWSSDQPFSPLAYYKKLEEKTLENFRNSVITSFGYTEDSIIKNMYTAAGLVLNLERLLDEKWI
jgi:hypothetical protein